MFERGEGYMMVLISDGVQLLPSVVEVRKGRSAIEQIEEDTAHRPNVRLPRDLKFDSISIYQALNPDYGQSSTIPALLQKTCFSVKLSTDFFLNESPASFRFEQ